MSSLRRLFGVLVFVAVITLWVSCGGATADGVLTPTGGEVCLPDRKVCIEVPTAALEDQEVIRIGPSSDKPGGALSDAYDISSATGKKITFLKPAKVTFALDIVNQDGVENQSLLRIYTKEGNDWQPLDNAFTDRVRGVVQGEVSHLSPFVVLRSDRLPDGGLPIELDGGTRDGGVIIIPPFDAGPEDAGFDAGRPDAGRPDAGTPDAGMDAGTPDAGTPDAGTPDAGTPDAGTPDAGTPDAGTPDAGVDAGVDAGIDAGVDAGIDAGFDAGIDAGDDAGVDAGEPDAGDGG
ncbi:MAG: hypothetical protein QM817_13685 [Archangium sp.]